MVLSAGAGPGATRSAVIEGDDDRSGVQARAQLRKAKGMAASQEELNRQQQELASEQEEFAVERSKMVASFKAYAQQRMAELEVSLTLHVSGRFDMDVHT